MALIATETPRPRAMARASTPRRRIVRFFAFEGAMRVVVEADSEDDARYLCREMHWDFICLCDT